MPLGEGGAPCLCYARVCVRVCVHEHAYDYGYVPRDNCAHWSVSAVRFKGVLEPENHKRESFQGTEAIRQEEGKSSRQGHSGRGFRVQHKRESMSYGTICVGSCLGSATDQTCDPGQVNYLCGLPFAHE